jgi:hypothetical protein
MSYNFVYDSATDKWVPQPLVATSSGGGGGGDASAANQATQIGLETSIRDRLPATLGTKPSAQALPTTPATGALTSISGSVATGGTAQTLAAANSVRTGLTLQNTSAGTLRVNPWGTASASAGYKVDPDALLVLDAPHCGVGAVSIWGATTAQTFIGAEAV